jgi:hypothetical protein
MFANETGIGLTLVCPEITFKMILFSIESSPKHSDVTIVISLTK